MTWYTKRIYDIAIWRRYDCNDLSEIWHGLAIKMHCIKWSGYQGSPGCPKPFFWRESVSEWWGQPRLLPLFLTWYVCIYIYIHVQIHAALRYVHILIIDISIGMIVMYICICIHTHIYIYIHVFQYIVHTYIFLPTYLPS